MILKCAPVGADKTDRNPSSVKDATPALRLTVHNSRRGPERHNCLGGSKTHVNQRVSHGLGWTVDRVQIADTGPSVQTEYIGQVRDLDATWRTPQAGGSALGKSNLDENAEISE